MAAVPRRTSVLPSAATAHGTITPSQAPAPGNRRMSYAPTAAQTTAHTQAGAQASARNVAKAFEETLSSEFQDLGDQSQGMHDDPRAGYRARKRMFGFVEVFLSLAVIALIMGTLVMFVLSTSSQGGTVKPADDSGVITEPTRPTSPTGPTVESTVTTTSQNETTMENQTAPIMEQELL